MTQMSGDSFLSRMLRPTYVVRMSQGKDDGSDRPMSRGARTAKAKAMDEIDQLVLERAAALGTQQFRAELECTQDFCSYCRSPRRRFRVDHSHGPFADADLARKHGQAQARLVYGSEHRVHVMQQTALPWTPTEETR